MLRKSHILLLLITIHCSVSAQDSEWDWVKALHTNQIEGVNDVVADPVSGDVYVVGYWRSSLAGFISGGGIPSTDFNDTYGGEDGLVAKYDRAGNLLWAFKVGGGSDDRLVGIDLDSDGNLYITGFVSGGKIHFTGTSALSSDSTYLNTANDDFIVASYDAAGRLLWSEHSNGDNKVNPGDIAVHASGVYVTGSHKGSLSVGGLPPHVSTSQDDLFLVKYSLSGNLRWHLRGSGDRLVMGEAITCDETHIYVTGEFTGESLSLLDAKGDSVAGLINTNDGKSDVFLISCASTGDLAWVRGIAGPADSYGFGLTADRDSLYLVGSISDSTFFPNYAGNPVPTNGGKDAFMCSLSKTDGTTGWVQTLYGEPSGDREAFAVSMDISGNLYTSGYYQENIIIAADTAIAAGNEDIFLASFTKNGQYKWMKSAGGMTADFAYGLSASYPGSVYMAGDYGGLMSFDAITVPDDVNQNIYLAKLKLPCLDAAGGILLASDSIVCESDTLGLVLADYYGKIQWQSSPPGLETWSMLTADSTDSFVFVPAATADYRAYLSSGSCSPDSSNVLNIEVQALPTADITGDVLKCEDGSTAPMRVNLTGTAPWELVIRRDGAGDSLISGISANPYLHEVMRAGTYTLASASDKYCNAKVSGSAGLSYLEAPSPDPGAGANVCGLVYSLQAVPSADSGFWSLVSGPGTVDFSPSLKDPGAVVTVSEFGDYTLTWSEWKNACIGDSSVVIGFFEPPLVSLSPDTKTCGLEFSLNVLSTSDDAGMWSLASGPGMAIFLPDERTPDARVQVDAHGNYTFQWTASNAACLRSASMDVEFMKIPAVEAGSNVSINMGEAVQLNGSLGDSLFWSPDYRLSDPHLPNPLADPWVSTTYYLNIIGRNGCFASDSLVITVLPPNFAEAGEDVEICPGESVQLRATGGDYYLWSPSIGLNQSDIPDPLASPPTTTTYVVQVTRLDGITDSDTVVVTSLPTPLLDAGADQSICSGDEAQLNAVGEGEFLWIQADGLSNVSIPNPMASLDVTSMFRVRLIDDKGCLNEDSLTIYVLVPPIADAGPDQEHIGIYETKLEAGLGNGESGTWFLVSGNGVFDNPDAPATRVSGMILGENKFEWQVTNDVCPVASDQVVIRVTDFIIPTVITPNGDGKNDHFHVEGIDQLGSSELLVLDRWGEKVFRAAPYVNDWDGLNQKGEALPADTYYTILKLSETDIRKGYIMIIR